MEMFLQLEKREYKFFFKKSKYNKEFLDNGNVSSTGK